MKIQITINELSSMNYGYYPVCSFEGELIRITGNVFTINCADFGGEIDIPLSDIENINTIE